SLRIHMHVIRFLLILPLNTARPPLQPPLQAFADTPHPPVFLPLRNYSKIRIQRSPPALLFSSVYNKCCFLLLFLYFVDLSLSAPSELTLLPAPSVLNPYNKTPGLRSPTPHDNCSGEY